MEGQFSDLSSGLENWKRNKMQPWVRLSQSSSNQLQEYQFLLAFRSFPFSSLDIVIVKDTTANEMELPSRPPLTGCASLMAEFLLGLDETQNTMLTTSGD